MCTASWITAAGIYRLFFNRDEKNTRSKAVPPARFTLDNTACVMPVDPDSGGTWIGVNEYGISICLLNYYSETSPTAPAAGFQSRGQIITTMLREPDRRALEAAAAGLPHRGYRPFRLLVFFPDNRLLHYLWDGNRFGPSGLGAHIVSSSSFKTAAVIGSRQQHYHTAMEQGGLKTAQDHIDFHKSHRPEKGAFSVCMHRPDAHTVSFSQITVDRTTIRFTYIDNNPCQSGERTTLELARKGH